MGPSSFKTVKSNAILPVIGMEMYVEPLNLKQM